MKLIEPIENLGALSTNDAPLDALETWEPVGRNLLNYIEKPVFDVVGELMVVASNEFSSTSEANIYIVNLTNGVVTNTGIATRGIVNVAISQDGQFFYICKLSGVSSTSEDCVHSVYEISDFSEKFSSSSQSDLAGINQTYKTTSAAKWETDSSSVVFGDRNKLERLNSTTWTTTQIGQTLTSACILEFQEVGSHYFILSPNRIEKMTTAGVRVSSVAIPYGTALKYNAIENDLLALNQSDNTLVVIDQTDLLLSSPVASVFNRSLGVFGKSIKTTATHLIVRSLSTSPYWSYYNLVDYSLDKSLPALPDIGEGIAVGTNYTVVQQNNGIALIDNTDDSIVSQQNPSVATGDQYIYVDNVYEALTNNNDQPDTGTTIDPPTWLDRGKINPLRMFDGKLDSPTASQSTLEITINPEQVASGIALFNVDASTIRITMTDPIEGLVYDSGDISMIDNSGVTDWYSFYFAPYIKKSDFVTLALPPYADAEIVVTVSSVSGPVSVGEIVLGRTITLGISQFGSSVGILDFSEKEQDQFGNFNIIERKFSKRADYDVKIPTNTVSGVQRILSKFRAAPAVWVGDENREETIVYGYYKSFDIVLSNPALSDTSILVEGL